VPTTTLTPNAKQQFFDSNGNPLAGGKLYTYAGGTTTLLATYTDSTGTTLNSNPIILDSRGEANVWLAISTSYKFKLTNASDVQIWVVDGISSPPAGPPPSGGTVTSVGLTAPALFTVTGSPVTTSGTLSFAYSGTALPVANGGTGLTAPGANGNILTSDGTVWTSSALSIPSSGGVGTLILALSNSGTDIAFGGTVAGSNLNYAATGGTNFGSPGSGTWKCLGIAFGATFPPGTQTTALWIRTI
jgi:hypothetical protein